MVSRIRRRSVGVVIRCLAREAAEDDGELIPPRQARYDRGHTRSPATDASWYRSHFGIDDSADPIAQGRPCPNGIWNALAEHRVHAHASTSEVVRPHSTPGRSVTLWVHLWRRRRQAPGIGQPPDVAELPLTRARKARA